MSDSAPNYPTIEDVIGATPLVRLVRLPGADNAARGNVILGKLEGNNPAGSVKDRPAISMIRRAEERGTIKPGDTLIEATSGNTGIALAMAAAIRGYRMLLVMPEDLSVERAQTMKAFGAELVLTPRSGGMEYARDLATQMDRPRWPALKTKLAEVFRSRSRDEWCDEMEGTDVCFAPVLSMDEAPSHPHNVARGTFETRHGVVQAAPAPRFSRTRPALDRPPAHPGQHTDEVLVDWGFAEDEVAALRAAGAVA